MPGTASSDLLVNAWTVVLLVLGSNAILAALLWYLSQHYARALRGALELNRELTRRIWTRDLAKNPESAGLIVGLDDAAARTGNMRPSMIPEIPELRETDEALLNHMGI